MIKWPNHLLNFDKYTQCSCNIFFIFLLAGSTSVFYNYFSSGECRKFWIKPNIPSPETIIRCYLITVRRTCSFKYKIKDVDCRYQSIQILLTIMFKKDADVTMLTDSLCRFYYYKKVSTEFYWTKQWLSSLRVNFKTFLNLNKFDISKPIGTCVKKVQIGNR